MRKIIIATLFGFSTFANAQTYRCDVEIDGKDMYFITAKVDDRENQFTVTMENKKDKIRSVVASPTLKRYGANTMSIEKDNVLYMRKSENGLLGYALIDEKIQIYLLGCE